MKIGLSSYSLYGALEKGDMDILGAIEWVKNNGGEHIELAPFGYDFVEHPDLIEKVVKKAAEVGIALSSYTVGAQLIQPTDEKFEEQIKELEQHVEIANKLGIKKMRHDVASRPAPKATIQQFDEDLPKLVEGCRRVADYAAKYGITTSIENHGYHLQNSERVSRLIQAVNRPNYRWTIDIGNFLCVDEDPISAVKKALPLAVHIHFKDFYVRDTSNDMGEGWFPSAAGRQLRGAIVGHGDVNIPGVVKLVKESGYDGFVSVEFEGMEDCQTGSRLGMANLRYLFNEA